MAFAVRSSGDDGGEIRESLMRRNHRGRGGLTHLATRFARLAIVAICVMTLVGNARVALAGDNPLLGTWKLKSFVRQDVATGERRPALGEHPEGYLGYAPDRRMYALFVAEGRVVPAGDQPTEVERAPTAQVHGCLRRDVHDRRRQGRPSC